MLVIIAKNGEVETYNTAIDYRKINVIKAQANDTDSKCYVVDGNEITEKTASEIIALF